MLPFATEGLETGSDAHPAPGGEAARVSMFARHAVLAICLPLAIVILWQVAARDGALFDGVLPSPKRVWSAWTVWAFGPVGLGFNAYSGTWLANLTFSLERVAKGFMCAILVGVPAGIAIGWNRLASGALDPTIQLLRPIPITFFASPRCLMAAAREPPISPTPTMATVENPASGVRSLMQRIVCEH